jgi:hypothetical protein
MDPQWNSPEARNMTSNLREAIVEPCRSASGSLRPVTYIDPQRCREGG